MRAGARTLTLLGTPRIFLILKSLAEGPKARLDLRRDAGAPAQSTLRNHLKLLETEGAVTRVRQDSFPGALEYKLTDGGRDLLTVVDSLERWFGNAPSEPLCLGEDRGKVAIKGLVDSWCATVLTCLASKPLTLTELDKRITAVSYPTIERCLETMRLAEQLDVGTRDRGGTPYALTGWLRLGIAPLAFAARWEHQNRPEGVSPVCRVDIEGASQLAAPMLDIRAEVSGACQLAVRGLDGTNGDRHLGLLEVRDGKLTFGAVDPKQELDAWVSGPVDNWFSTMIDADSKGLRVSGDRSLPEAVFDCMHQTLFDQAEEPEGASVRDGSPG